MRLLFCCLVCGTLFGHDGFHPESWEQWIGSFHFVFLHFPIALIIMTVFSDVLNIIFRWEIFEMSSRFMLTSAAVLAPLTAVFGWVLSRTETFPHPDLLGWHMWSGIATALFTPFVAYIRNRYGMNQFYWVCLIVLLLLITITAELGEHIS